MRGGESEEGSKAEGIRFVSSNKMMRYKTSSSVATRAHLIPSNRLTHAGGGLASVGSKSVSSLTKDPFLPACLE